MGPHALLDPVRWLGERAVRQDARHESVRDAAVVLHDRHLIAYYVPAGPASPSSGALRRCR